MYLLLYLVRRSLSACVIHFQDLIKGSCSLLNEPPRHSPSSPRHVGLPAITMVSEVGSQKRSPRRCWSGHFKTSSSKPAPAWQMSRWQGSSGAREAAVPGSSADAAREKGTGHTTAQKPTPELPADEQGTPEPGRHPPLHPRYTACPEAIPAIPLDLHRRRQRHLVRKAGSSADTGCLPAIKCSPLTSCEEPRCDPSGRHNQYRQQAEAALRVSEEACLSWEAWPAQERYELDKQWERKH